MLAVRGKIDGTSARRLQTALGVAVSLPRSVVIDLSDVTDIDDEGSVLLLNALRRLVQCGTAVTLVRAPAAVRAALERCALARHIHLLADRTAMTLVLRRPSAGARSTSSAPSGDCPGGEGGHGARPTTLPHRSALLADATLAIEQRHHEPDLTLADVARQIATSRRQLQRIFAEFAGTAFRDELTAVRIQHAAALLHSTELPVNIIARRVGYRQASQFSKAFRRHHGQPPSAFRRTVRAASCHPWSDDPEAR